MTGANSDALSGASAQRESVLLKNIDELVESRRKFEREKSAQDHVADAATKFSGSMLFVYVHAVWFAVWMLLNSGWLGVAPFDEFPFGLLTMIVSLEAIFLSTFVLVSQNRMGALADKRADLDVQVNLLAEREVTNLLVMVHAIVEHLGLEVELPGEIDELEQEVSASDVLQKLEEKDGTPNSG